MRLFRCVRWVLPALMGVLVPAASFAGVLITVNIAPPVLPVYEQPPCPEQGWMWSPGYWAYGEDGYYWVPGEWVPAPYTGALWTPPWWGFDGGRYVFHDGYWGDRVGYYGGIDYGYGYMGVGFSGGEWRGREFTYNTAVMRVNTTVVRNTYVNETIVRNTTIVNERHVAFSGGPNGIHHDPLPAERAAMSERHSAPTPVQQQHIQAARADRTLYAKVNGGHPHTLAVARPNDIAHNATAPSTRETVRPEANRPVTTPGNAPAERNPRGTESRSAAGRTALENHPATATRSETRTAPESRSTTARTEPRTSPSRTEQRAEPRTVPAEKPRSEPHANPRPRTESWPAPAPRSESRPEPAPRSESRPAPEPRPAPQHESRPAPQHEAAPAAHATPQHESKPAPTPRQEKPKPQDQ